MSTESDGWSFDDDYHHGHFDDSAERQRKADEIMAAAALKAAQSLDGLELATASAAEVDVKLEGRINALFARLQNLAADRDKFNSARDQLSLAENAYNQYPSPKLSQSASGIKECVAVNIELCQKYFALRTTLQLIDLELTQHTFSIRLATKSLREVCDNIEKYCQAGVAESVRYIGAARHFADEADASPHLVKTMVSTKDVGFDFAMDAGEDSNVRSLTDHLDKIAARAIESDRLAQKLEGLGPILTKVSGCDDILEPVRPTEEEVQRYLMQLEQRMRDRIRVHIEVKPLLALKSELSAHLNTLEAAIAAGIAESEGRKRGPKLGAVVEICEAVSKEADRALRRLRASNRWEQKTIDALSTIAQPNQGAYDTRTLPVLRDLIKKHAYSLGRRNEARAAERATRRIDKLLTSVDGVLACKSVKHALAWQEQHEIDVATAAKKNYSLEVKIELLVESVRAYNNEVSASETLVHRQTVSLLPGRGIVPCDELRALFNAAATLYRGNDSFDEGRFPLF